MTKNRVRKAAVAAAATAMLLAGCTGGGGGDTVDSGPAVDGTCKGQKFKIAKASPSLVYVPYYVAEGAGFLEEEGVVPETVEVHTGAGIIAAAVSGSVDLVLVTAGEAFVSADEGARVQAFAQVTKIATNVIIKQSILDKLGLTPDSPDTDKLAALKGLRIGVTGNGSGSDQVVRYLATEGGLNPDKDMEIIATGGSGNSVAGFSSDRFDAIAISSPQSDVAIERGKGAYLFDIANGDYEPLENNLYITATASTRVVEQRSDMLKCFTTALGRAQQLIQDDPQKAAEVAKPFLGDISPSIYASAFESNTPSWFTTPAVNMDGAKAALDFQNRFVETPISEDILTTAVNTEIASSPATG